MTMYFVEMQMLSSMISRL